jgi:hypothetical protein
MPRPVRFLLTAHVSALLVIAIAFAVAVPLVLLSSPEASARTPASLRRPLPITLRLVVELTLLCGFMGVLLFGACWFVSSRRWAVAGRYACPLIPVFAGLKGCIEWLWAAPGATDTGEVLNGALLFFFCMIGSYAGGYLGDRRRLRAWPPVEPHPGDP